MTAACPECRAGKHWNCTIETMDDDDSMTKCPCLAEGHIVEALTPYAGSSGWSGSDTSEERAQQADSDGTTKDRQQRVMKSLEAREGKGVTVWEVRQLTSWHHGQASSVLSVLHKEGRIARLTERRNRCHVYVLPEWVNGREVQPHGRNKPLDREAFEAGYRAAWGLSVDTDPLNRERDIDSTEIENEYQAWSKEKR